MGKVIDDGELERVFRFNFCPISLLPEICFLPVVLEQVVYYVFL